MAVDLKDRTQVNHTRKRNMDNTLSPLKAFKGVTSLELSKWYMGA